jgi:hypothetical protein
MAGYVSVRLVWVRRSRCGAVRFVLVPRGSVSLGEAVMVRRGMLTLVGGRGSLW